MNRIKHVFVKKQRTNRWLAAQMGKSENTILKRCLNKSQPSIVQNEERLQKQPELLPCILVI